MKKHIILLGSLTAAALIGTAVSAVSLYEGRNQTIIKEYDLYGDPSAAEGLTYTVQIGDDEDRFYADITYTIGGESRVRTEFGASTIDSEASDDWYDDWYYFDVIFEIESIDIDVSGEEDVSLDSDYIEYDYAEKIIQDYSPKVDAGSSADFKINLQDYVHEMPYILQFQGTSFNSWYFSEGDYPCEDISDLYELISIPLLDPYYLDVHMEKDAKGNLTILQIYPETTESFPLDISAKPILDGNSFLFYFAPVYSENENGEKTDDQFKNTIAGITDRDVFGLYRADLRVDNNASDADASDDDGESYYVSDDGYWSTEYTGISLTRLDDLPADSTYIGGIGFEEGSELVFMMLQTPQGIVAKSVNREGVCDSMNLTTAQTDSDSCISLSDTNTTDDGIFCWTLSDGTVIVFQADENGKMTQLMTTELIDSRQELDMIAAGLPDYCDYIDYYEFDYDDSEETDSAYDDTTDDDTSYDDTADDDTSYDDTADDDTSYDNTSDDDTSYDNTAEEEDATEDPGEEADRIPYRTWGGICNVVYKDGKITCVKLADHGTRSENNPGSVYVTTYGEDGLEYCGLFRNMYTTYTSRYDWGYSSILKSDHYVNRTVTSGSTQATWN